MQITSTHFTFTMFTFWFMYVVYVFDFVVFFGSEIGGILTVCGFGPGGVQNFDGRGEGGGYFTTDWRRGGGVCSSVLPAKSLFLLDFFWTEIRSGFGQPVALFRFSRPLACLSYALCRKLYYYNTTSCHICQPLIVFYLCNFLVDILDGRCYSAV